MYYANFFVIWATEMAQYKFDSALRQKIISTIRELLKASFKPLPQGFGAISGGSRGTNHQYLYFMREWEGEQLDLRQFLIFSTG